MDRALVTAADQCPCLSGNTFATCCGPLLAGAPGPTAERVMRSRFTAFVRHDDRHLLRTWHPSTRPRSIAFEPDLLWRRLLIVDRVAGGPFDDEGIVEFEAFWRQGAQRGALRERSRFRREQHQWYYVDGDVR
ncbi:YchJ family protein [Microbacterium sp. 179-I 3D3 NHS]|uniref:YchJ family protein n=1 Tax=unclassified Microbacterium TaxID=2609290 RepID=UPI0039A39A81